MNFDVEIGLLEICYLKLFDREPSYNVMDNIDLYPSDWGCVANELKKTILKECIDCGKKIVETKAYRDIEEGIRIGYSR